MAETGTGPSSIVAALLCQEARGHVHRRFWASMEPCSGEG